jgi:hypothetical protein
MTEGQAEALTRMQAHMAAARRLRAGIQTHGNMRGLELCFRVHVGKVAALAGELCARPAEPVGSQ